MARSQSLVLALVGLALVGGGAALWLVLGSGGPAAEVVAAVPSGEPAPAPDPAPREQENVRLGSGSTIQTEDAEPVSVAWPVELSLELVRAAHLPRAEGVPPMGTGRTAAIAGKILNKADRGVAAQVRFLGGANAGRVLTANAEGEFGATDLYPGIDVVEIRGPGIPGSVREVRLRQTQTELLNISYGLPGTMIGTVYGPGNEPLPDVSVVLDGQHTTTNEEGDFFFDAMAPGTGLVLVLKKEGYAHQYGSVAVAAARQMTRGRYRYAMQPEASLRVVVSERVGGPGPAKVIVLPANTDVARNYPWWEVNPVDVLPGSSTLLTGLPPIKVALRTFHAGAVAEPADQRVVLRSGQVITETIRLKPGPKLTGVVRDDQGRFVQGAVVSMEAPDRVGATMFHLQEMPMFLETEVIPPFPPAVQQTTTDSYGRYVLSSWSSTAVAHYLTAESPDGKLWAGRVVKAPKKGEVGKDLEIDLTLAPVERGSGVLTIEFPGRIQGLPVEVSIDGLPLDPGVVPLGQPLVLEDLPEGTWRLSARWDGQPILGAPGYAEVEVRGEARYSVPLPQGAIYGQDEETLVRAGRGGS